MLATIGRKKHRVFVAEVVRHTLHGYEFPEILLGAVRVTYPRLAKKWGDAALAEFGRGLLAEPQLEHAVKALLDERAATIEADLAAAFS